MRVKLVAAAVGVGLALCSAPGGAHHSFAAEFDANKPLQLRGTLAKWEMVNPHSWFHLNVKNPDGTVVTWLVEGGSPNSLIRMGVTKNTIPIGTEIIVEAYQARDGSNKVVGRNFVLADGSRLFLGGSAPGASGEK